MPAAAAAAPAAAGAACDDDESVALLLVLLMFVLLIKIPPSLLVLLPMSRITYLKRWNYFLNALIIGTSFLSIYYSNGLLNETPAFA